MARQILKHWETEVNNFVLVFPNDYRAALEALEAEKNKSGVPNGDSAVASETASGTGKSIMVSSIYIN